MNGLSYLTPTELFSKEGVQIKEIDLNQPCNSCNACNEGYTPHEWRKDCKSCKCARDNHEIIAEQGAKIRLGLSTNQDTGISDPRSLGYSFVPPGLTTARQVDQFYSTLPPQEVPRLGTKGEQVRSERLVKQLPRQDLALTACKFIEADHRSGYEDFIAARNEIALDIGVARVAPPGVNCAECSKPLQTLPCVSAPRMGTLLWHPGCFKCSTCEELLVDLAYCVHDEKLYCERHYSEQLKPRCAGCDEVDKKERASRNSQ
ncbi:hypothetical protein Trydic_g22792 [Trypoxylus dichotomus]